MYIHVHTGEDFGEPISRGEMHENWWSKLSLIGPLMKEL